MGDEAPPGPVCVGPHCSLDVALVLISSRCWDFLAQRIAPWVRHHDGLLLDHSDEDIHPWHPNDSFCALQSLHVSVPCQWKVGRFKSVIDGVLSWFRESVKEWSNYLILLGKTYGKLTIAHHSSSSCNCFRSRPYGHLEDVLREDKLSNLHSGAAAILLNHSIPVTICENMQR